MFKKPNLALAFSLVLFAAPLAYSQGFGFGPGIANHVLLISIDGMHAVDYENCVNSGTCPNLAALGKHGVELYAHYHFAAVRFVPRADGSGYRRDA